MTEEGKAAVGGLQSGGPNLSLFGADPPLHSQDSAKNSPTVGTDPQEQENKTQVIQKEQEELDRKVIKKKEEVELKKAVSGDDDEEIVSKLVSTTTTTLPSCGISTTSTTRKPLPVNDPKPVLPPSKQLRMVSHSLLSLSSSS